MRLFFIAEKQVMKSFILLYYNYAMNKIFDHFKTIFNSNGYRLYMIGGTSRDYLLNLDISDYDFVTDATPEEINKFLNVDMTFSKFGTVKITFEKSKIDIVTFRKEGKYKDSRHPSYIKFVKNIKKDYRRRDFTINAIYIDENYNLIDPTGFGLYDLENKILRTIGNPNKRFKEDPLRILRAERFVVEYNLKFEKRTKKAINKNYFRINLLSKDKVEEEKRKLEKARGKNYEKQ
jgi:tRNA nucleotidyltransferase (CCA-adding enzyme)